MNKAEPEKAISLTDKLADLLRDKRIGLTTVIAIADALAAEARFNIWFLDNVKSQASESEVLAKIDEYGCLTDACIAAIENFNVSAPYKFTGDRSRNELKDLETALKTFVDDITKTMVVAL